MKLPQTDSSLLLSLETLICSGFESKHKCTVSAMITLWNSTFGNEPDLEYPPRVTEAVQRLRPIADIRLPSFPYHHEYELYVRQGNNDTGLLTGKATSTGPTFEDESQDENLPYNSEDHINLKSSTSRERTPHSEPLLPKGGRRTSPNLAVELPHSRSRKRAFEGTPENSKRKVARKNLTPRLRHNDSQIQFAAIDSSPLVDAVLDSQLLTDRQREVKERQKEVGAMFANSGASPRLKTKSGFSHLTPSSDSPILKQTGPDDPSTPDLPMQEKALLDEYITSSPTPRHGGFSVQMNTDMMDPPSSPPEQSLSMANPKIFAPEDSRKDLDCSKSNFWDVTSSPHVRSHDISRTSTDLGPSAQVEEDFFVNSVSNDIPMVGGSMENDQSTSPQERPRTPVETLGSLSLERQVSRTPNDVFVDALSSPAPPTPAKDIYSDQSYVIGMQDDQKAVTHNLAKQNDSQIAYSLSETDEDSMLRLITKFDKPGSQQDHTHNEISPDNDANESNSSVEGIIAAQVPNIDHSSEAPPSSHKSDHPRSRYLAYLAIGSEPLGSQSTVLKSPGTSNKIKKTHRNLIPKIEDATAPAKIEARAYHRGIKAHLQEKVANKRTRRSTLVKRKIADEHAEVLNSLAINAVGKTF